MALATSFRYSEGLVEGIPADGNSSRANASVLLLEDRLSAASAKYGSVDRTPFISSGSATHSRNLFYPLQYGEFDSLPVQDIFINGQHFPFTVAGFKEVTVGAIAGCTETTAFEKIPNHPAFSFDPLCEQCFDLDRNGSVDVLASWRDEFNWQWQSVDPALIDPENGEFTNVDIDCDLKEESILEAGGIGLTGLFSFRTLDFQEGDIDTTIGDLENKPQNGMTSQNAQIYSYASNTADSALGTGTYLLIEEGKLYSTDGDNKQFVRSTQQKDSVDIVQRVIQLNKNTGHFCTAAATRTTPTDPVWGWAWNNANPNPVEVCVRSRQECFFGNTERTCMYVGEANPTRPEDYPVIYVRSRVEDKHGRKWVTDTSEDPGVEFVVPEIP